MKKIVLLFALTIIKTLSAVTPRVVPAAYTKFISIQVAPTIWMQGDYGVWYKKKDPDISCSIRANEANRITRPFIICEGFDVGNYQGLEFVFDQVNNKVIYDNKILRYRGYLDYLRDEGFDVIVLNLRQNTNNIEDNAQQQHKPVSKHFQIIKTAFP